MVLPIHWVSGFFGFKLGFARNPILLWIFHFEIHIHPITRPNQLFGVGLGGFDRINWVCPTDVHYYWSGVNSRVELDGLCRVGGLKTLNEL
jgi:hypothetical protein